MYACMLCAGTDKLMYVIRIRVLRVVSRGRSRGKITVPFFFPEDEFCLIGAWCHLFGVVCCNNASDRDNRKRPK